MEVTADTALEIGLNSDLIIKPMPLTLRLEWFQALLSQHHTQVILYTNLPDKPKEFATHM